jgi:hypothetical protein
VVPISAADQAEVATQVGQELLEFGHNPTLEHAMLLEPQIEVVCTSLANLDKEPWHRGRPSVDWCLCNHFPPIQSNRFLRR